MQAPEPPPQLEAEAVVVPPTLQTVRYVTVTGLDGVSSEPDHRVLAHETAADFAMWYVEGTEDPPEVEVCDGNEPIPPNDNMATYLETHPDAVLFMRPR